MINIKKIKDEVLEEQNIKITDGDLDTTLKQAKEFVEKNTLAKLTNIYKNYEKEVEKAVQYDGKTIVSTARRTLQSITDINNFEKKLKVMFTDLVKKFLL